MKICTVGIGYVGLSISLCLAHIGHEIFCYDENKEKIQNLSHGILPIYEPKMGDLLLKNKDKLNFVSSWQEIPNEVDAYFIAVGTPTLENSQVDTTQVENAIKKIVQKIEKYTVIINKSTVPIGYNQNLKEKMKTQTNVDFDIVSNPEFLRQGNAIDDFLKPNRIIIGTKSEKAKKIISDLYEPLKLEQEKILFMDENSAELTKYASNSFLALKISFINEIAKLAENTGANIEDIKKGMALDERIGNKFLNAGIGFGGSCFPKDTKAILNIAKENNIELKTINAAVKINDNQIDYFIDKILNYYENDIKNKTFAIWGLAFKPNTNDIREAPSIKIIKKLTSLGAKIQAYDPKAKIEEINQSNIKEKALENADALVILTEWDEFKNPDFNLIKEKLKDKIIFDGRNIYINKNLKEYNLKLICVGKNER